MNKLKNSNMYLHKFTSWFSSSYIKFGATYLDGMGVLFLTKEFASRAFSHEQKRKRKGLKKKRQTATAIFAFSSAFGPVWMSLKREKYLKQLKEYAFFVLYDSCVTRKMENGSFKLRGSIFSFPVPATFVAVLRVQKITGVRVGSVYD